MDASVGAAVWKADGAGSIPLVDSTQDGLQPQSNRSAVVPPAVTDDSTAGYAVGSYWIDTATDISYVCLDASVGAAVWYVTSSSGFAGRSVTLIWGAGFNISGRYAQVNGTHDASTTTNLDDESQSTAPFPGTLISLSWNTEAADATTVMKVTVNGLVTETITLTGLTGSDNSLSTTVVQGDLVAIEYDSGTAPKKGTYSILLAS
jgi:hypothetical protein